MRKGRDSDGGIIDRICVDCEADFVIEPGEAQWLLSRGWELYKRCARCREAKRARNAQSDAA